MSFCDIPVNDIKFFLNYYKQPIHEDKLYLSAWNYIITNDNILVPISIANWIRVYNKELMLNDLPDDIIKYLMLSMNIKDLFTFCSINKRFNNFCKNTSSNIVSNITGIDTNNYNLHQLKILYLNKTFGEKRIVSKYHRTFILKNNGEVYFMGNMDNFQCDSDPKVMSIKDVIKVDFTQDFNLYLTKNGKVYIAGILYELYEEYNLIPNIDNAIDIAAIEDKFIIVLMNGNVVEYNINDGILEKSKELSNLKNIISVKTNINNDIFYLSNNGKIYKGIEEYDNFNNVKQIKLDEYRLTTTQIVDKKISYQIYNFNWKDQIFETINIENIIDISDLNGTKLLLDNNGDVYVMNNKYSYGHLYNYYVNEINHPNDKSIIKIKELQNIIYIYNGDDNWFFVDINYNLYAMGFNTDGELGLSHFKDVFIPTLNTNIKL